MPRKSAARSFGSIRRLPSGRFQARYWGPDGIRYSAQRADGVGLTFDGRGDAEAWLSIRHTEILRNEWLPPTAPKTAPVTLKAYAESWLADRQLETRTRDHYRQLLRDHIVPTFGDSPVPLVTPAVVRTWHAGLGKTTGPTARAHAYSLFKAIMATAVHDDLVGANPCRIRGAGQVKTAVKVKPATLSELQVIANAVPAKYQLMILLAAWCAMRQGELFELRRSDVNVSGAVINVRRGVVRTDAGRLVKDPKSDAGKRSVSVPPHLTDAVKAHLKDHAQVGPKGLLFPARHGAQLAPSTLYKVYYPARAAAGRPDLRFHDLRHTGAVLAASTGATLAELMSRLGHSTPAAAMRYQHAAADRDRVIADALSALVTGDVVKLPNRRSK